MAILSKQRNKINSNQGSSKPSKLCSLKTLLRLIVVIIAVLFVISTHLFSIILTNHVGKSNVSHGIHSSIQKHKSNLMRHVNQNNNSEKEVEKVSKNTEHMVGNRVPQLPMSETPALIGASKGIIECDVDVNSLVYWNDPQGSRDINYVSPFVGENPSVSLQEAVCNFLTPWVFDILYYIILYLFIYLNKKWCSYYSFVIFLREKQNI